MKGVFGAISTTTDKYHNDKTRQRTKKKKKMNLTQEEYVAFVPSSLRTYLGEPNLHVSIVLGTSNTNTVDNMVVEQHTS